MKINGIQKLTLLDFPQHVACTVFSAGCDLRCPFCHNAGLVRGGAPEAMTEEEFFAFLKKRTGTLDGVAFTGGEPLIQEGFVEFALRVRELGFAVKLDTNGTFPDRLRRAIDAGAVDYVAMDVKNSPGKYALTCGVKVDVARVSESAAMLISGDTDYEFRTTVVHGFHEAHDFELIGEWMSGAKRYFLQQFRDSGQLLGGGPVKMTPPSREEMECFADILRRTIPTVELRGV